jgi:hypothetical protein
MTFTFGSDPEFMLSRNGKIYSAIGIVKGTKERRKKIGKHAIYYDNVMAECSIAPGKSRDESVSNIKDCLQQYAKAVAPYKLETRAAHQFDADQLKHPDAMKISCDPETCVYQQVDILTDKDTLKGMSLRTAGGHVHLGSEILRGYNRDISIFLLDLFLGLPSIYIDTDPTTKIRKELYGKSGRYRVPIYGVEYRTLGNFWLASPKLVEFVYDVCAFVLDFIDSGKWESLWHIDEERLESDEAWSEPDFHPSQCFQCIGYDVAQLRDAIDTSDVVKGQEFLTFIKEFMPAKLHSKIAKLSERRQDNFYKEWDINA